MDDSNGIEKPGKIIALHLNYPSRIAQRGRTPEQPSYFLKPATSVAASGSPIERPAGTELLAFEGEIALVIGTGGRHLSPEAGWDAVAGITAANDFGVYDLRWADKGSNLRSKGGDGFTPLGPVVIPAAGLDPAALRVRTWVNGELVQDDTTADLVFPFGRLVADLSQLLTLEAGDVILTGTPAGSSVVVPGDTVEVEVDAPSAPGAPTTGRLVTPVVEGATPLAEYGARPKLDDIQRAEAWGSREAAGLPAPFVLDDALRVDLASVGTATLSSQLRKRGREGQSQEVRLGFGKSETADQPSPGRVGRQGPLGGDRRLFQPDSLGIVRQEGSSRRLQVSGVAQQPLDLAGGDRQALVWAGAVLPPQLGHPESQQAGMQPDAEQQAAGGGRRGAHGTCIHQTGGAVTPEIVINTG
ncbi:MAG: fumarylacetoacetate hydrolase family protein [Burkholderiales bacterium]|nr:fumarylacetoacetate hydrolase family protein [Burkholderiales bacterium]